jgi:hypothetical protein
MGKTQPRLAFQSPCNMRAAITSSAPAERSGDGALDYGDECLRPKRCPPNAFGVATALHMTGPFAELFYPP